MVKLPELSYPIRSYKEPIVKRYGKEVSLYKEIQTAADGATIYDCLEKYGCIDKLEVNKEQIYADVTAIQEDNQKFDIYGKQKAIEEIWNTLPAEIREESDYNVEKLPEIAKKYMEKQKAQQKPAEQTENKGE